MNAQENLVQIFRACIPENLVLRTPRFGSSYPQGVHVPLVKNHWVIGTLSKRQHYWR